MIRAVVVRVVVSCAVGATALVASSVLGTPPHVQVPADTGPVDTRPVGTDPRSARGANRVSVLLAEHGCWSGEAPEGAPAPRHAVITPVGGGPRLVAADVGFGIWLEGEPGVLHGFCP